MNKFLFEIGTEEIPAEMIAPASRQMRDLFRELLAVLTLGDEQLHLYNTPRRLALLAEGLPDRLPDEEATVVGPPASIGYDTSGQLTRAGAGFARSQKISEEALRIVETDKGRYLGYRKVEAGVALPVFLTGSLVGVIEKLTWPRNMYWRESRFRFVRPIRWLLALWNEQVLEFSFEDINTNRFSRGHRFLGDSQVEIAHPDGYVKALREAHVLVDVEERRKKINEGLKNVLPEGTRVLPDPGLLELTVFLNEYPTPLKGGFDESFLQLPREILVTVMRHHQKYFAALSGEGDLEPCFVTVTNVDGDPGGAIRKGHERVLRARLEDAVFFWKSDRKVSLKDRVQMLADVTFQQELGSYLEKTRRLQRICDHLAPASESVRDAALLCKADLTTETVFEISELQGIMGGLYAREEGYPEETWKGIYEHYRPVAAEDSPPSTTTGALVSLADRLDTMCGCFHIGIRPRGSSDPFALRRQAQGLIAILLEYKFEWTLDELLDLALGGFESVSPDTKQDLQVFLRGRLDRALRTRNIDYDVVNAVVAGDSLNVAGTLRRAEALQEIREEPDFERLATAFKRIRNILSAQEVESGAVEPTLLREEAEKKLFDDFVSLEGRLEETLESSEYGAALKMLSGLSDVVDAFFDQVMVMAEDTKLRANRLRMLERISARILRIADISQVVRGS